MEFCPYCGKRLPPAPIGSVPVKRGRPPKLDADKRLDARRRHSNGESIRSIARVFGVGTESVRTALREK